LETTYINSWDLQIGDKVCTFLGDSLHVSYKVWVHPGTLDLVLVQLLVNYITWIRLVCLSQPQFPIATIWRWWYLPHGIILRFVQVSS
jgi:hypothetical protein